MELHRASINATHAERLGNDRTYHATHAPIHDDMRKRCEYTGTKLGNGVARGQDNCAGATEDYESPAIIICANADGIASDICEA